MIIYTTLIAYNTLRKTLHLIVDTTLSKTLYSIIGKHLILTTAMYNLTDMHTCVIQIGYC